MKRRNFLAGCAAALAVPLAATQLIAKPTTAQRSTKAQRELARVVAKLIEEGTAVVVSMDGPSIEDTISPEAVAPNKAGWKYWKSGPKTIVTLEISREVK